MKKSMAGILSIIMITNLVSTTGMFLDVKAESSYSIQQLEKETEQIEQEEEQQLNVESEEESETDDFAVEFSEKIPSQDAFTEPDTIQEEESSFGDGEISAFSAGNLEEFCESGTETENNVQKQPTDEWILDIQNGEDITSKLNDLLLEVKDEATDENPCKVIIPPGNYELTGTICMYSNIHLYAVGAVIKKTSPRKEIMLRLGNTEKSQGGYGGYCNVTIEGGIWDANYECTENKEQSGGFVGFRIGHASNVIVRNVTFLNNLKSHFLELAGVKHAQITGCTFQGYWEAYDGGGQECIQLDACMPVIFPGYLPYDGSVCEDIIIKNNVFQNVFAGVGSHSMMFDRPYKNITISDNRFVNVKKRAVWCLNYQNSVVKNNIMSNVGGGIYVRSVYPKNTHLTQGQKATNRDNQQSENIIVENNRISVSNPFVTSDGTVWNPFGICVSGADQPDGSGSTVPRGTYVIRDAKIRNNIICGNGYGIRLILAENCMCSGNSVKLDPAKNFSNMGISAHKCSNILIKGNKLKGGKGPAIYTAGTTGSCKNHVISENIVAACQSEGILADRSGTGVVIEKNSIAHNQKNGIMVSGISKSSVIKNKIWSNIERGIFIQNCPTATVNGNQASKNRKNGIEVNKKSKKTSVTGNASTQNKQAGICISGTDHIWVKKNKINKNGTRGILVQNCSVVSIYGNSSSGNSSGGIEVGTKGNTFSVSKNLCTGNKKTGIYFENISNAVVYENRFEKNKTFGVALKNSSIKKFTKNILKGNGHSNKIYNIKSKINVKK